MKSFDAEDRDTLEMLKDLVAQLPDNQLLNTKAIVTALAVGDLKRALGMDPEYCCFESLFFILIIIDCATFVFADDMAPISAFESLKKKSVSNTPASQVVLHPPIPSA